MNAKNIPEFFGCMVFNDKVMKERLPKEAYDAVRRAKDAGEPLSHDAAKIVVLMKCLDYQMTHFYICFSFQYHLMVH